MKFQKSATIRTQQLLVAISLVLFVLKIFAWYLTASIAILTDALESTVNVIASIIGLYSIILASKPKDKTHPYGHGKIEFVSAAFEGILISVAGIIIIYESIDNMIHPHILKKLDIGMFLIALTAFVNYLFGYYCVKKGEKENSPILIAGGQHLKSDTYSSIGLLVGLLLLYLFEYPWIDSLAAMFFAFIIIFTGYKIIRKAISGIMDEADYTIIEAVNSVLSANRIDTWIDIHNMRIINNAGFYHIDCHLTVPYYISIKEGHAILDQLRAILSSHFKGKAEFFVHIDDCQFYQCSICKVENCKVRKTKHIKTLNWTVENLISNEKHKI